MPNSWINSSGRSQVESATIFIVTGQPPWPVCRWSTGIRISANPKNPAVVSTVDGVVTEVRKNWEESIGYKNVSGFKGSLLVVKSELDANVPPEVVDIYYLVADNSIKKKEATIKGADHRLSTPEMRNDFFELISDWFLETL